MGLEWICEVGLLIILIVIINIYSVGVVCDVLIVEECVEFGDSGLYWCMLVVMEIFDGLFNDIWGQYVGVCQVGEVLVCVEFGLVCEGLVGGGIGMICYEFKGGIGSVLWWFLVEQGGWMVGVLVQVNYGQCCELWVDGYLVGCWLGDIFLLFSEEGILGMGFIVVILVIDVLLLLYQCQCLVQCVLIGVVCIGGGIEDFSGDVFFVFVIGNQDLLLVDYVCKDLLQSMLLWMFNNDYILLLFVVVVEVVEEVIVNVLLVGEDMCIEDGWLVFVLKGERFLVVLCEIGWLGC